MKPFLTLSALVVLFLFSSFQPEKAKWVELFDGQSFDGWKVGNNAASFKIEDGTILVNGNVAHLFYDGPVGDHNFKNFEFRKGYSISSKKSICKFGS